MENFGVEKDCEIFDKSLGRCKRITRLVSNVHSSISFIAVFAQESFQLIVKNRISSHHIHPLSESAGPVL